MNNSSSDDEVQADEVQASAVPHVYSDDEVQDDEVQAAIAPCIDSDDERPLPPVLLHESEKDFIAFRNILSQSSLGRRRPGILINEYECLRCGISLGEYICSNGHCICFRCLRFVPNCLYCPEDIRDIYKYNKSDKFKEFKDMFTAFRQYYRFQILEQFFKDYGSEPPLDDQSSFERKYLKYKQKYLALKNMRRL
jgi:hypothetical protein